MQALGAIDYADAQLGATGLGAYTREALEICIAHGLRPRESVARANLGAFAFFAGRWDEALDWYESSRRVALEAGNDFGAAETDLSLVDILVHQGRVDEAEVLLRDAQRVVRAAGIEWFAIYSDMLMATIHLARGELEAAEAQAARAAEEFAATGNTVSALEASLVHAEAVVESGRPADALTILDEAERASKGEGASMQARAALLRGRALLALDRLDETGAVVSLGLESAREQNMPYEEALLLRVRAGLAVCRGGAGASQAEVDLAEADRILATLGARGGEDPIR